jgi:serine/threonine protein kinase/Flp pilus assembly protein TadD
MTPERWKRINEIFAEACERPANQRAIFLDQACGGDSALRAEVEILLASDDSAGEFLAKPANASAGGSGLIRAAFSAAADHSPEEDADRAGARIGRYTITGLVGEGGMGAVYRAVRTDDFRMEVAIKLLKGGADSGASTRRFHAERQILAGLQHPNIARLLDGGATDDGLPYLVMEYVEGRPLLDYAAALSLPAKLELFRSICSAVQYAHDHSVVHRDIKPGNILVGADGVPKLLDFGIAKLVEPTSGVSRVDLTATGLRPMTPAYASPEQIGGAAVTAATDIYSLGAVLYELLTGRRPLAGSGGIEPPSAITRGLDADLDSITRMALDADPSRRYASAGELSADIDRFLRKLPVRAHKTTLPYRARKFVARNRVAVIAAAASACLVVAGVAGLARLRPSARGDDGIRSIAVLPLENLSGSPEQEYFAEGMTDALIDRLSQVRDLRVISRTSSQSFKNLHRPLPEIAKALGVRMIAEGSLSRAGTRVRLAVRLIDARQDRAVWSSSYEGELRNIVELQEQVAGAIADEIGVALESAGRPGGSRRQQVDIGAYDAYLQGRRQYFTAFTEESEQRAIALFQQSLRLDPGYAPAYSGLADCYYAMSNLYYPPLEMMPKAKAAARRALDLDDSLASAHATIALVAALFDFDRDAAERGFQRALALRPSDGLARLWYAIHLNAMGRFDEAFAQLEQARKIDPVSVSINTYIAYALYFAGRYDGMLELLLPIAERNPDYHQAHAFLGLAYEQRREWPKAIAEMELAYQLDHEPEALAQLGHIYAMAGRTADARRVLDQMKQIARKRYLSVYHFGVLYAGLGKPDEAFRWLDQVEQDRSEWFANINVDPRLEGLRPDPRFPRILRIVGLAH